MKPTSGLTERCVSVFGAYTLKELLFSTREILYPAFVASIAKRTVQSAQR